jgi:hypothetical protein
VILDPARTDLTVWNRKFSIVIVFGVDGAEFRGASVSVGVVPMAGIEDIVEPLEW